MGSKSRFLHFLLVLIYILRSVCLVFLPSDSTFPCASDRIILMDHASEYNTCHRNSSSDKKLIFPMGELAQTLSNPPLAEFPHTKITFQLYHCVFVLVCTRLQLSVLEFLCLMMHVGQECGKKDSIQPGDN